MNNTDDPDKWIKRQNLQDKMDMLLREYEEKGIKVKSIDIVMLPPNAKYAKPYSRINLF